MAEFTDIRFGNPKEWDPVHESLISSAFWNSPCTGPTAIIDRVRLLRGAPIGTTVIVRGDVFVWSAVGTSAWQSADGQNIGEPVVDGYVYSDFKGRALGYFLDCLQINRRAPEDGPRGRT